MHFARVFFSINTLFGSLSLGRTLSSSHLSHMQSKRFADVIWYHTHHAANNGHSSDSQEKKKKKFTYCMALHYCSVLTHYNMHIIRIYFPPTQRSDSASQCYFVVRFVGALPNPSSFMLILLKNHRKLGEVEKKKKKKIWCGSCRCVCDEIGKWSPEETKEWF